MPQAITPELIDALATKLQIGAAKRIQGEIEIDWVQAGGGASIVQQVAIVNNGAGNARTTLLGAVTPGNLLMAELTRNGVPLSIVPRLHGTLTDRPFALFAATGATADSHVQVLCGGGTCQEIVLCWRTATGDERDLDWPDQFTAITYWEIAAAGDPTTFEVVTATGHGSVKSMPALSTPGTLQIMALEGGTGLGGGGVDLNEVVGDGWTQDAQQGRPDVFGHYYDPLHLAAHATPGPVPSVTGGNYYWGMIVVGITSIEIPPQTFRFQVETLTIDRGRKMGAAQLDVMLPNVDGTRGYYTQSSPIFVPNNQCRAYAWYGVRANRVQIGAFLLDRDTDHRDPDVLTVDLKARSRTKILLTPHLFVATASQDPTDANADRTEGNGVFLNRSPEYIAAAVLDMAGWPSADRDLETSGVTIPEYRLSDGGAWLDQIAGSDRLTTIAGWDFREDELGVAHFGPNLIAELIEPDPDWTFEPGLNVLAYDHQVDDEARVTRVRVSGPMTTTVPIWKEEWATTLLLHPVGAMHLPAAPTYLYVIDRLAQFGLVKLALGNRTVAAKWDISGSLTNQPIGLSRDPLDAGYFYVLDAHLPGSGTYTNCKVRKFDSATKALVSTTNLPNGQWSDMKFDGSHLWLTNFGDDKLYKKTFVAGGTAGATASYSYAGHANPTGMFLTGTTIGLFFNGGAAFYLVDTSAPGTITGTQSTKGTHILGGEIDSTDDSILYATNEDGDFGATAGHVWKFDLAEDVQVDVVKWATDQALEDAMGLQAGLESRVHDLHPLDGAHRWERRDLLISLQTINSQAQAQAVADAQLVLAKRLRRTLDLVTIGNPALQIDDAIEYPDTVAGTDAIWMLDTKRERLEAGQYVTSMSVLPWEAP